MAREIGAFEVEQGNHSVSDLDLSGDATRLNPACTRLAQKLPFGIPAIGLTSALIRSLFFALFLPVERLSNSFRRIFRAPALTWCSHCKL